MHFIFFTAHGVDPNQHGQALGRPPCKWPREDTAGFFEGVDAVQLA